MPEQQQWLLAPTVELPEWFMQAVRRYTPDTNGHFVAQLLWRRGIQDLEQLAGFVNPHLYQPASPFQFGQEMRWAVERLQLARDRGEKVAIWGDFDADGITATAVLWDGLGQFFPQDTHLFYYIPNRFTESHGLNCRGIDALAQLGCQLIVTCDTGSTNTSEINYAQQQGIDVIVTDHHTLPPERPSVTAIINPRYLPTNHQLFHLSGVAVAYKLVEALYQTLPQIPQQPLEDLLDLVAIGLIADLVQLWGDCRYLAQMGIERLQQHLQQPAGARRRPGVGRLLELCQKTGDRPTDISFGLGPRINAVSRIQGDARFCVELLTSRTPTRCNQLAQDTELANTRRRSLQKDVSQQVAQKLKKLDLSTTSVIVLEDPQWPTGVLGLVAGQVAQETGRPTILLSTEGSLSFGSEEAKQDASTSSSTPYSLLPTPSEQPLARGSARSVNQIDLYQLVKDQAHLLHSFGGHPFAAGLSLPVENIPLFTEAINQRLRQSVGNCLLAPLLPADLVVTVADLGKDLFRELKLLEPCGMGNHVPKLLIQNCWFENAKHRHEQDWQGKKVRYIKTEFDVQDDTESRFPGTWWGHYKEELPVGRCDCLAELDYNTYKKRYEIRLIAVRSNHRPTSPSSHSHLLDWRHINLEQSAAASSRTLIVHECPTSWDDLRAWFRRSLQLEQKLALAWTEPQSVLPSQVWQQLVGIAKYLSRTGQTITGIQLLQKLGISSQLLKLGFAALTYLGFQVNELDPPLHDVSSQDRYFKIIWQPAVEEQLPSIALQSIDKFLAAVQEEQFQRQYFCEVPLSTIQSITTQTVYEQLEFWDES